MGSLGVIKCLHVGVCVATNPSVLFNLMKPHKLCLILHFWENMKEQFLKVEHIQSFCFFFIMSHSEFIETQLKKCLDSILLELTQLTSIEICLSPVPLLDI